MGRAILSALVLTFLAACTANEQAIFRTYNDPGNRIAVIDAKQRVVLSNIEHERYSATGAPKDRRQGTSGPERQSKETQLVTRPRTPATPSPKPQPAAPSGSAASASSAKPPPLPAAAAAERVVGVRYCAEPSPDVFTVLSSALSFSGTFTNDTAVQTASANLAHQISEAGSTISRTQTIQTLRELMYRTCERYLSGAITKDDFYIQAGRDQRILVSILAIEQLTNAARPEPVRISVTSSAEAGQDLVELRKAIDTETQNLASKKKALTASESTLATRESDLKTAQDNVTKLEGELKGLSGDALKAKQKQVAEAKTRQQNAQKSRDDAAAEVEKFKKQVAAAEKSLAQHEKILDRPDPVSVAAQTASELPASQTGQCAECVPEHVTEAIKEIVKHTFEIDEVMLACLKQVREGNASNFCKSYLERKEEAEDTKTAILAGIKKGGEERKKALEGLQLEGLSLQQLFD